MTDALKKALKKIARNEAVANIIVHRAADATDTISETRLYEALYMALTFAGAENPTEEASLIADKLKKADHRNMPAGDWIKHSLGI